MFSNRGKLYQSEPDAGGAPGSPPAGEPATGAPPTETAPAPAAEPATAPAAPAVEEPYFNYRTTSGVQVPMSKDEVQEAVDILLQQQQAAQQQPGQPAPPAQPSQPAAPPEPPTYEQLQSEVKSLQGEIGKVKSGVQQGFAGMHNANQFEKFAAQSALLKQSPDMRQTIWDETSAMVNQNIPVAKAFAASEQKWTNLFAQRDAAILASKATETANVTEPAVGSPTAPQGSGSTPAASASNTSKEGTLAKLMKTLGG